MKGKKPGPVALRYLSYRDRTEKEVADHLAKKDFEVSAIASTLEELKRLGYINDERFALNWGRFRMEEKNIGRRRLAMEMKARGLKDDTVERALDTLATEIDEWDLALRAGQKKMSTLGGVDGGTQRRRLAHYLQRRGFATGTVFKVVRELAPHGGGAPLSRESDPEAFSPPPDAD